MDQLPTNYLPDLGAAPVTGVSPADQVVAYPILAPGTAEGRSGHDVASTAAGHGGINPITAPPVTAEDMMRSELIQAEMAGVLALIANDFFSRQIEPEAAGRSGPAKRRNEPDPRPATGAPFNLCTLAQRHRQEFVAQAPEAAPSAEASTAAPSEPEPRAEPPADWFVDPELNEPTADRPADIEADASAVARSEPTADPGPAPVPAQQPWPENVIAFPIARRMR
jgi:hypothetical protein